MLNLEYLYPQVEEGLGCLTGAPGACVLTCLDLRLVGQLDSQVARSIRLWQEAHRQVVINHKNSQAITDWLALNSSDGQWELCNSWRSTDIHRDRQTDRLTELKDRQTESHLGCPTGRLSNLLLTDWEMIDWKIGRLKDWRIERLNDWQTERLTDWQTERLADWKTDRLKDWQTEKLKDWQTERLKDWQADWKTDRLTDWQADRPADWQTDRQTDRIRISQILFCAFSLLHSLSITFVQDKYTVHCAVYSIRETHWNVSLKITLLAYCLLVS